MAIVAGVENAVRLHIERGDDLNARDAGGQTPLMLAAARNKLNICKLLLDAGADPLLADPKGENAFFIANASGAREVALLLASTLSKNLHATLANDATSLCNESANENEKCYSEPVPAEGAPKQPPKLEVSFPNPPTEPDELGEKLNLHLHKNKYKNEWRTVPTPPVVELIDFDEGCSKLDLSGWEQESEVSTPAGDPSVVAFATAVQNAISKHTPIDLSAEWDEFEAYLPERASPLPKADDAEARECLRSLLLRSIREGSVPNEAIEDLTLNDDGTPNEEAEALLRMVVNDLGAEADERHEYSTHYENFMVHVDPRETADEEQSVEDALAFIDELKSRRNDPLRIYQRSYQSAALLTAGEEIALGKAMEQSIEAALDALAGSSTGIEAVIESSQLVKFKMKPLRWMSAGTRNAVAESTNINGELHPAKTDGYDEDEDGGKGLQDDPDQNAYEEEISEFLANAERLLAAAGSLKATSTTNKARREALGSLRLSGPFLLKLSETGCVKEPEADRAFRFAIQSYVYARERMTVANLKLVQSVAKKYLYSGIPLDDLIQEGNIGLLSGVERYGWRRGFRFSTYATWWIRQQVSRFVANNSTTIRMPDHIHQKVQRIRQVSRAFETLHNRTPTAAEISPLADLPLQKIENYLKISNKPLPIHELDIDSMIATEARDEYTLPDPMDAVCNFDLPKVVDEILKTLKPKYESIIRMRFGIGVAEAMTLDEIGKRMGLTRERIRQIEAKAMRTVKNPSRLDALRATLHEDIPTLKKINALDLSGHESPEYRFAKPSKDSGRNSEWKGLEKESRNQELLDLSADKSARKTGFNPTRIAAEIPSLGTTRQPTAGARYVPKSLQNLLDAAALLGASVEVAQMGVYNNICIDFRSASSTPPRSLLRKLVKSGFKFWPGKGYCR